MREIKFRAWDKYDNKIRLVKSVNYADDGFAKTILVHLVGGINGGYVNGESCELMQYTGLTDLNGKEVYEGDIVQYITETDTGPKLRITKVIFKNFGFMTEYSTLFAVNKVCDVIGNVFENPELIEVSA